MANVLAILIVLPFAVGMLVFAAGLFLPARLALSQWHELAWSQRWRLLVKVAGLSAFAATLVHFAVWLILIAACGGSAADGKVEGGRYYVGSRGRYTEVSETTWQVLRFQERLGVGIGLIGIAGLGGCLLVGRYEHRQASRQAPQPLNVTALLPPGEAPGARDAVANRPASPSRPASRFPVGTVFAALLLMLALDAAAMGLLFMDVIRFFQSLIVLWLIVAPCWLVAIAFSDNESRVVNALTVVAIVGATAFVGGFAAILACAAIAMLHQDLVVAILVLIPVSLLALGCQFLFAMLTVASIRALFSRRKRMA